MMELQFQAQVLQLVVQLAKNVLNLRIGGYSVDLI